MKFESVKIDTPKNCNIIIGTAHFIKTVEDIYEVLVNSVPNIKFGVGFCEASGPCLVRSEGNDEEFKANIESYMEDVMHDIKATINQKVK